MPKAKSFGANLQALREQAGFSRPELATLADIGPEFLWHLEKDNKKPGLDILKKLAVALGVDMNTLTR